MSTDHSHTHLDCLTPQEWPNLPLAATNIRTGVCVTHDHAFIELLAKDGTVFAIADFGFEALVGLHANLGTFINEFKGKLS